MKTLRRLRERMFCIILETKAVTEIPFLSGFDHFKRTVDIVVALLCQINLLRCLSDRISNEIMHTPNFVFCKLVQRNNVVQILRLKGYIL